MINLEKIKQEKYQPPPFFKKTCPCIILPPPFLNFSDSPPPGEVIKIYFPLLKNKSGGPNYVSTNGETTQSMIKFSNQIRSSRLTLSERKLCENNYKNFLYAGLINSFST